MSRPKKVKVVRNEPRIVYFKPTGVALADLEQIELTVEEVEALRLSDLNDMKQKEAASLMKIHQSTFHRTLKDARKKVAQALINGKAIKIKGGNYKMVGFGRGQGAGRGQGRGRMGGFGLGPSGTCVCPKCGYEMPHQRGIPCYQQKCPKCGTMMTRGN